jgi:dephospho-CoA kinase
MKIAITGGIGSGKSFVCERLEARGIRVYDCDREAKRLMRESEEIRQGLKALVGEDVYVGTELNKPLLAKFLLQSEENKQAVNAVVHPAVASDFEQSGIDWLESAILFDSGFDRRTHFDWIICVTAPLDTRVQRVMNRDGISRELTMEWVNKQMPQEEVLRRSNAEIVNDGHADIDKQLDQIIYQIQQKQSRTMEQTILSIAGKPGLYKLVSRGKMNLIVEALDETHKRIPAFGTDRITSLSDIAMFTDAEDVPLMKVMAAIRDKEEKKEVSFPFKKASSKELREYFASVLPDFDRERVHDSDIRKLLTWYNILVKNGITDFEEEEEKTEEDEK